MQTLFKKLEIVRNNFQELKNLFESSITTGEKEALVPLVAKFEQLMDEARSIERHFLFPAPLPLSVEIFDAWEQAKKDSGFIDLTT